MFECLDNRETTFYESLLNFCCHLLCSNVFPFVLLYTQILKGLCISKTVFSRDFATEFKKKFALISITVTLSFCICYAPFLFFHVYLAFQDANTLVENHETLLIANRITRFILYLSCSLNYLLYAFQSSRYRGNLRKILRLKKPSRVGVSVIPLKDMK